MKLLDNHFLCHRSLQSEINHKPYSLRRALKLNAADQQVCLTSMTTLHLTLFHQFDIKKMVLTIAISQHAMLLANYRTFGNLNKPESE